MKAWAGAILLALVVPGSALGQEPTIQQRFDAATAAQDAGNWQQALRLLEALESRVGNRNLRTLALIRVRKGTVLFELGRFPEARAAVQLGLPGLPVNDASLNEDRFLGLLSLGRIAEHELDYPAALAQYRLAAAIPVRNSVRLLAYRGIVQTQTFTDAPAALRDVDIALQLAATTGEQRRPLTGQLRTLKGRALLNLGRYREARLELEEAQRRLGGLTQRVDRADVLARSDLAIAALLDRRPNDARRYLAYTGAGRFERGSIGVGSRDMPDCGPELAPDDVAVIEATVTADGSVVSVMPVYASRQGPSAFIFARAVSRWLFDPEGAQAVPALFRSAVRIEIRCSKTTDPHDWSPDGAKAWLAALDQSWATVLSHSPARSTDALRAELARHDSAAAPARREVLPLLLLLADRPGVPAPEREAFLRRALSVASEIDLPPGVIAAIACAILMERTRQAGISERFQSPDFAGILSLAEVARSPETAAYVRLAQARHHYVMNRLDEAAAIAAAVRALPAGQAPGPLATQALEIEMAVQGARGNLAAARAARAQMGPDAERCGLPAPRRRLGASSADFPNDAMRWGFEGWAASEVMVAPNGEVVESRTVAAYPPFVFGDASRRIADRSRHHQTFAADHAPCPGAGLTVHFRLPD